MPLLRVKAISALAAALAIGLAGRTALPATPATTSSANMSGTISGTAVQWKKIIVETKFRSEGVAVADVNRDGRTDSLIGDVWYESPDRKIA